MRLPKEKWPETNGSRGILMFAQIMSEMLTPTTFESFRVYSLDTIARVSEALELVDEVRRQRVPRFMYGLLAFYIHELFVKEA